MFCKNCGANLPDGSTFCGSCGAKQDAPAAAPTPTPAPANGGYTPQLNLNNIAIGNVKGMRLIGVAIAALLLIFSITDYFYLGNSEFAINGFIVFEDYFSFDYMSTGQTIFMILILISNYALIAATIAYIVFSFLGGPAAESPIAVQKCVLCGHAATIALAVGLVAVFLYPAGQGAETGYKFQGWFALIIAVLNSLYILPAVMKEALNKR